MKSLLSVPFLYPFYGLVYLLLQRPDLGLRALISALLQIVNPFMWLSPSLVARSHSKFFNAVFESAVVRGSSSSAAATRTAAAAPLSADQRARLDAAVAAATAEATAAAAVRAARARDTLGSLSSASSLSAGELLSWARWALLEPEGGGGGGAPRLPWYLRWLRRTLVAPLYLAFPLAPRLLSIRDTRDVAVDALRPFFEAKGLRVGKRGRGGSGRGFSSSAAAASNVDDACFFARRRAWECRSFGAVAAALGCVPVLSWLLAFVTTAGAALWAADLERFGGGSRALVPPPAVPAPAAGGVGGSHPLQQQHQQVELASKQAPSSAASASKQEL